MAVLAAMGIEVKPLARRMHAKRTSLSPGIRSSMFLRGGLEVHIAVTGVGRAARESARAVVEVLRPSLVVSTGTAGGLDPALATGSAVVASQVLQSPACGNPPIAVRADVIAACEGLFRSGAAVPGGMATVARPAISPSEKADLFRETSALVCEMETYHIAAECACAALRFAAVRVVSDTALDMLPDFGVFMRDGRIDAIRMAEHFASRPDEARRFAVAARKTAAASRRIPDLVLGLIDSATG